MPELPEVEVVRLGLTPAVTSARVASVSVEDARALKRHVRSGGALAPIGSAAGDSAAADFERRLTGVRFAAPVRRGKFLWVPILAPDGTATNETLLAHLGMSGQLLLRAVDAPDDRHVRARLWLEHPTAGELRLDFADQRLFGSLAIDQLDASGVPSQVAHIARDPLDPRFEDAEFVRLLRLRNTAVKRALLDQTLLSGVGNIYADEALWRARVHPETLGRRIGADKAAELLQRVREVFHQALAEGGTSFDAQYVNVNGQAGHFARSLQAYGREDQPCPRCGEPIRRVSFMNRSSHFCPRCQRRR